MTMPANQPPVQVTPARSSAGVLGFTGPAAVGPQASLRGTQMLAATIQAPDLMGYYYGLMALAKDFVGLKRALSAIADRTFEMWETMSKTAYDAQGIQAGPPKQRLWFYRGGDTVIGPTGMPMQTGKTDQMWQEQQAKYPKDFVVDMADFETLVLKEANGEL